MVITPITFTFNRGEPFHVFGAFMFAFVALGLPIVYGFWYTCGQGVDPAETARFAEMTRIDPDVAARSAIKRGDMRLMVTGHPRNADVPGDGEPASNYADHSKYIYLPSFHTDKVDNGHHEMRIQAKQYARRYNAPIIRILRERKKAMRSSAR